MKKVQWFWISVLGSVILRFILFYSSKNLNLSSRPEIATPLTSLRRLAEGYWLKQSSMSPYSGSMYHGSPLLLTLLGPLTVTRIEGQPDHLLCGFVFVIADVICAMLIRATGETLQAAYSSRLKLLGLHHLSQNSVFPEVLPSGDLAALVYLWNPFTIVACIGLSTSAIENLMVVLSLYGACKRLAPLAAFGWVMATHLSLYPAILLIPVILLFGYGLDAPPRKLFLQRKKFEVDNSSSSDNNRLEEGVRNQLSMLNVFSWKSVSHFLFWTLLWSSYVLVLCSIYLRQHGGLQELFKRTYGFILTIPDLSPNIGVFWYFFAEVFDFFRNFFLIVFHGNILLMMVPLALRLNHRPCFLAFVYIVISSMLKSYPSVGDSALYLGLLGLFAYELRDMQFSFFLISGYVGASLLSPVMHNLWIWRGTGNANFYFGTAITYACFQIILVVESVSAMLNHDRMLKKLSTAKLVKT
ncbi:PREDICTED: phosphatidylinositol glycan anchor biosynthesis class U protein-like isoform X2 [Lupinus angustifolius]|uniref:phosphatidylinositol glycan anchor biosynthesis class U protein-like isoform X2 n=1 Tax=Lupinus angustifolius TaxID=3871 RepID=UPI00092EBA3B|nr:PREDICTED: phosphatidylinositol glycan anchor biosynthesis class U protein-like isoform X2 [Lupinus angustifolius]